MHNYSSIRGLRKNELTKTNTIGSGQSYMHQMQFTAVKKLQLVCTHTHKFSEPTTLIQQQQYKRNSENKEREKERNRLGQTRCSVKLVMRNSRGHRGCRAATGSAAHVLVVSGVPVAESWKTLVEKCPLVPVGLGH